MTTRKKTCLGIGSWTYPYHCGLGAQIKDEFVLKDILSPKELIEKCVHHGVRCVQICENRPLDIYSSQELIEIADFAKKQGVVIEVGMRGATPENLNKMLDICIKLESKLLRCVVDTTGFEPTPAEIIENFKAVLPILQENGIVLGIENHDRFKACVFAEIIATLNDSHYGIILDTTNSLSQEEPLEEVLNHLAKYTVSLHLKDYTIRRSAGTIGLEIVGTPVGQGRLQVENILERVSNEAQQDFSTIIEFWMPSEDTLEDTLQKEAHWAERSVAYLTQIFTSLRYEGGF